MMVSAGKDAGPTGPASVVRTHTVHKDVGESRLDETNIKDAYV